jgi:hypothetical protein
VTKQKATCTKDLGGGKVAQSPQIETNMFQQASKIFSKIWEFFYFFFLSGWACNKIWLSPLVDDGQTAYLTKLVKNMIKKKKKGAWLKGKEKKIIMLYLVTTKLNT